MKIALVQQHATKDRQDNLDRGIAAFHQAVEAGAQLVAFAELAFLPFLPASLDTLPTFPVWVVSPVIR